MVYRFENEQLVELLNRTAHAAALSALVKPLPPTATILRSTGIPMAIKRVRRGVAFRVRARTGVDADESFLVWRWDRRDALDGTDIHHVGI
jgi:hypothetical protein